MALLGVKGLSAHGTFFNSLFERAFKMMKNSIYFIVIALSVVEFLQDSDLCKLEEL